MKLEGGVPQSDDSSAMSQTLEMRVGVGYPEGQSLEIEFPSIPRLKGNFFEVRLLAQAVFGTLLAGCQKSACDRITNTAVLHIKPLLV